MEERARASRGGGLDAGAMGDSVRGRERVRGYNKGLARTHCRAACKREIRKIFLAGPFHLDQVISDTCTHLHRFHPHTYINLHPHTVAHTSFDGV